MGSNILIVDDISMNRKILKNILKKHLEEEEILEAKDGFEALKMVREMDICLVILDIMMPGKDGLEVLTEMKADPQLVNIPVLICSAIHEISSVETALSLGALDYFTKPLTEEQMRVTIPLKVKNALEYYEQKNVIIKLNEHLKGELQLAKQLQKSLILEHYSYDEVEIWGKYIPCEEIGGDFFSIAKSNEKCWFMIADVLGHGVPAAMVSVMMKVIFNNSLLSADSPETVLKNINDTLCEIFDGTTNGITSAFVGCLEGDMLTVSNAGHPYPVLIRKNKGTVENLEVNGYLSGVFKAATFDQAVYQLESGDRILLFTDGIFDKGDAGEYAELNKVMNFCSDNLHMNQLRESDSGFLDELVAHFSQSGENDFKDDVAILLIGKK